MIWFTGCPHFDHINIIKFCNRPFKNVEEMNETILDNYNKHVKRTDTFYILGDFSYRSDRHPIYFSNKIKCKNKYLIRGNHDKLKKVLECDFVEVNHYREIKINKQKIILFHYPIESWDKQARGSIHLHSHTHKDMNTSEGVKRYHVGVDTNNFNPVSLDEILERYKKE